jgi:hypothetical protein
MVNRELFFHKYVFNPSIIYFIYLVIVAVFGLTKERAFLFYAMTLPWIIILLLFFYMPFLRFLFHISEMSLATKINHVLEHGTIHFMKAGRRKKCRIGGRSFDEGFRIYGDIESPQEIKTAFEILSSYLGQGHSAAALSKYCGSNTPILGGISFALLTLTVLMFAFLDFRAPTVLGIVFANTVLYFLLRYPIGKYFQKKFVMRFDFADPRIHSINRVEKEGYFERNPVFFVKTEYRA